MSEENGKIKKVSIVCSKGSLDGIYPALIMANGARMAGIEASIFFTFFGLYAILKGFNEKIKIATVGNPAMRVPHAKGMPRGSALLCGADAGASQSRKGRGPPKRPPSLISCPAGACAPSFWSLSDTCRRHLLSR